MTCHQGCGPNWQSASLGSCGARRAVDPNAPFYVTARKTERRGSVTCLQ
jgi:hypothetical protein